VSRFRTAIALAAALACGTLAAPSAQAADPFEIHAILPVTGGAAFLGKAESASLAAFEEAINKTGGIKGRPVKIVIDDDQTNPQIAVQLMNQVLARKPSVVFDGGPAATCRATAALVSDGPVLYCLTPVVQTTPGGYVFSALYSTDAILGVSLRYLRERGLKRIAVLNGTDATGQAADDILQTAIKLPENARAGMSFVAFEHFNLTDLTVQAQLARIKAASPQALIAFTTGTAIATVLHGIADVGLDIPIVTSPGNMAYGQMESYKSFLPKELLFAGSPLFVPDQVSDAGVRRAVLAFGDALKPSGQRPDLLNVVAWDPVNLVAAAFQKLGTDAGAAAIRKELAGIRNVPGVLGRYDFSVMPQRGIASNWVIVERWDPDKDAFVAVSKPGGGL
jgi:branched-chain amino acid transport system substrate-binding protein